MKAAVWATITLMLGLLSNPIAAQGAPPERIRGTIAAIHAEKLEIKSPSGKRVFVTLSANPKITALVVTPISSIKPGSFIGTTARPQPDGSLKAVEVHVFPESMRGLGEGHYPWDVGKDSTMTNGTVGNVAGTAGREITVKYASGEQRVHVPKTVPIVTFEPGESSLLRRGAHVIIFATRAADGSLSSDGVTVGRHGLIPPM